MEKQFVVWQAWALLSLFIPARLKAYWLVLPSSKVGFPIIHTSQNYAKLISCLIQLHDHNPIPHFHEPLKNLSKASPRRTWGFEGTSRTSNPQYGQNAGSMSKFMLQASTRKTGRFYLQLFKRLQCFIFWDSIFLSSTKIKLNKKICFGVMKYLSLTTPAR